MQKQEKQSRKWYFIYNGRLVTVRASNEVVALRRMRTQLLGKAVLS